VEEVRASKLVALTEVNSHIYEAAEARSDSLGWEFFCECGHPSCDLQIMLTAAEYESLRDRGKPVLWPGHRVDEKERARALREDSLALQAQAQHQIRRARENLGK
jgi:hypothetical protein